MASVVDPFGLRDAAPEATAVIDGDRTVSYAELVALVAAAARDIGAAPAGLMVLGIDIALEPIVSYLAALSAGRTVLLVDPATSQDVVSTLMERYRPALVRGVAAAADVDPSGSPRTDLLPSGPTVLLGTSGSTGSPKVVRLPYVAVDANASSIAAALQLGPTERAALSLPLFYSYGLSVLNSHLRVGATVVAARDAVTSRPFWTTFDGAGCTSFAGVPYTYAMLQRMRIRPADHPSLRTMTQAGGKLDVDTRRHFHAAMSEVGGRFIVMYGQTEATARMSVLPHECFHDHEASVGWAIPGGRFEIVDPDGRPCDVGVEGDVVYEGTPSRSPTWSRPINSVADSTRETEDGWPPTGPCGSPGGRSGSARSSARV